jgi:hypothetical protein
MGRNRKSEHSIRAKHPGCLREGPPLVVDVLDDLTGHHRIERAVGKGKVGHVGLHHLTFDPRPQDIDRSLRDIGAHDLVPASLEHAGERSLAGADIEYLPARFD